MQVAGRKWALWGALVLCGYLVACGGGGSGSGVSATVTPTPSASSSATATPTLSPTPTVSPTPTSTLAGTLLISEVGSNANASGSAWFEVYNPGNSTVNLADFTLKTGVNGASSTLTTFSLPSVSVAPGAYLVIAGQNSSWVDGSGLVYVGSSSNKPYWNGSGSIELLKSGATIDFVSFGASVTTPTTSSAWSGSNVSTLSISYGYSIVRAGSAMSDTNTAADWSAVDFATPGGLNDVPVGAVDADGDGVPDSSEIAGTTFAGLNLYAMGARTGQKDIFIEVDYMSSSDLGIIPQQAALDKVVAAFAAKNIAVHFDAGSLFGEAASSAYNWGGGNAVAYNKCVGISPVLSTSCDSSGAYLSTYKSGNMDVRRRPFFHYMLFANSQNADGSDGSSGVAELTGNDVIITLGGWGLSKSAAGSYSAAQMTNLLNNFQASTVMHELGHNLGLYHGGNDSTNYKPNYFSIMNYLYQLQGLVPDPTQTVVMEPYFFENNLLGWSTKGYCDLSYSPCSTSFVINYSDGSSSNLVESSLLESNLIGRGAASGAYADWDANGALSASAYSRDINRGYGQYGGDGAVGTLSDYNDWANLVLPFARYTYGNNGASLLKTTTSTTTTRTRLDPLANDAQPVIKEDRPHRRLH